MRDKTSFTELSTLSHCEKQWHYRYVVRPPREPQSEKAYLGTLSHNMIGPWWDGDDGWQIVLWNAACNEAGYDTNDPQATCPEGVYELLEGEPYITARWLMERYIEHYGKSRGDLKVIGTELYAEAPLPGTDVLVQAWFDQLVLDKHGDLWLVERKTMGRWDRLDLLEADPQLTLYVWLLRTIGIPVKGVLFDAIRTYRWKKDEHPTSDSFQVLWIDRSDKQIAEGLEDAKAAVIRRAMLGAGLRPVRNIGPLCGQRCDFKEQCWAELQLGEPEIEVVND